MTVNRNAKRTSYDNDDVESLRAALRTGSERHTPKRKALSLRGVIQASADAVNDLRQRGYTIDQICQMITEGGFEASHATLRRHISAVRDREAAPRRSAKRKRGTREKVRPRVRGKGEKPAPADETTAAPTEPVRSSRGEFEMVPDRDDL